MNNAISVKLINSGEVLPASMAEHAAKLCYQPTLPPLNNCPNEAEGATMDKFVNDRLLWTGHHTTLEHQYFSFEIEGISVGDIDFGLHLASPFYNSDQRSGRFCTDMFASPDYGQIEEYIKQFWPDISDSVRRSIMDYIRSGIGLYQDNVGRATTLVAEFLRADRPNLSDKAVAMSAPKIAQEQMRVSVPVIFPTALVFTIDLSALVALWESAWTPVMRYITYKMKWTVLEKYPNLIYMFDENRRRQNDWACQLIENGGDPLVFQPRILGVETQNIGDCLPPEPGLLHPIDRLHFTPETMDKNTATILVRAARMSLATMGQDQRHRTIRRGLPHFTGEFYLPPAVREVINHDEARNLFHQWRALRAEIPPSLSMITAPYGAVVCYDKAGSVNAVLHELGKRLCWCAQEEIYELARQTRIALGQQLPENHWLFHYLEPPCLTGGKCGEGARYCGRDLNFSDGKERITHRRV